jgi:hypothetical protein
MAPVKADVSVIPAIETLDEMTQFPLALSKITSSATPGTQLHEAPPDEADQLEVVFQLLPLPIQYNVVCATETTEVNKTETIIKRVFIQRYAIDVR